jgi:hypothetical protein
VIDVGDDRDIPAQRVGYLLRFAVRRHLPSISSEAPPQIASLVAASLAPLRGASHLSGDTDE